ncbi:MAG: DMT family transporter [Chromatiales bacterium]|nr:DMT family transporter [Chromatiales bacterium]
MIAAGLLFATAAALIKLVSATLPNEMVVFFRNLIGLVALTPWLLRHGPGHFATRHVGAHLVRALAGLAAMYCYFYAIGRLPLAEAVLLNYSAPLFIPLAALLWVGEPFSHRLWWPIGIGFIGIALILKPGLGLFTPVALLGLAAGIFSALAMAGIRRLSGTEPATRIVFYFSLTAALVSALPLAWRWQTPDPALWLQLLLIGVLSTAAQLLMTRAYAHAPAAQVGPFSYGIVVFAGLLGWALWAEVPDVLSLAGAALVVAAGVLTIRMGSKRLAPPPPRPESALR